MAVGCEQHRRYKAKRAPRALCEACWAVWLAVQGGADVDKLLDGPTDVDLLRDERERAEKKVANRERSKVITALERELKEMRAVTTHLGALDALKPGLPIKLKKLKGAGKTLPTASYVMPASDWHVGERVRPETIGNLNEYTPDIAQERGEQFFKSNLIMLNAARAAWDIRQAVLWIGGDIITGYIHDEYVEDNFLSPTEESLLGFQMFKRGIEFLLAESDLEEILIPTSQGNHGRTTAKRRIATANTNSYEWLMYHFLQMSFIDEPRVKFRIADGYHNTVDFYGKSVRFHHGDAVGYGGGIGGLSIPMNKRIGRQATGGASPVMLDVIGHFHNLQFPKTFIVNGSLIGWNAFAETLGFGFEDPLQCSFVVDEKRGVVSNFNPIFVT